MGFSLSKYTGISTDSLQKETDRTLDNKYVKKLENTVTDYVKDTLEVITEVGGVFESTTMAALESTYYMTEGIFNGSWVQVRENLYVQIQIAAGVAACYFGGPIGCLATIYSWDASFNDSKLINDHIDVYSNIEQNATSGEKIEEHRAEIALGITIAANYYMWSAVPLNMPQWLQAVQGAEQIYSSYETYKEVQEQLEQRELGYQEWLSELAEYERIKNEYYRAKLDEWMQNMQDYDLSYDMQAGGANYDMQAGSEVFMQASVKEHFDLSLGIEIKDDASMDSTLMYLDIQAGSDAFEEQQMNRSIWV